MEAVELKQGLNAEDIIAIVTKGLGSGSCCYDAVGNPIFQTVCHNPAGHGQYKLYYYPEIQMFKCYTQCGDAFDIYELIQRSGKATNFIESYYYVLDFFGITVHDNFEDVSTTLTSDWDILNKYEDYSKTETKTETKKLSILSKNLLEYFNPTIPTIWLREGISYETMKKYGICMDIALNKIIIPHYDINGNLIGIRGRSYNQTELDAGKKYAPVYIENTMYNHPLGENLYGLNFNKETIRRTKKAVIFEGEKSVMKAETYYGENNFSVATCGSGKLSPTQINSLLDLGVNEIIIAFDKENDDFGDSELTTSYREKLQKIVSQFSPYVNTYVIMDSFKKLDHKDSPIDKGRGTLEFLLKHKTLIPSFNNIIKVEKGKKK